MSKTADTHIYFMQEALRLALLGTGKAHPNPLVGAVLVKSGRIIGRGYHEKFGGPHAEVNAIKNASSGLRGATLYVTLEPCVHFGKTPPCADLILKHGIKKVVIAAMDSNPLVSGKGVRMLKRSGVRVVAGVLEKEALELNKDFNHWIRKKTPYVTVKTAQSLDGKIATKTGKSKWITGEAARIFSHGLRAQSDAVLVGVNTILKDDPSLDVRYGKNRSCPVKIVLDSRLRMPLDAKIFSTKGAVMIVTTQEAPKKKILSFRRKAEVLIAPQKEGRINLGWLMKFLSQKWIVHVLVEGGGETVWNFLKDGLANEAYFFVAPKIIGGREAVSSVGGEGFDPLKNALKLKDVEVRRIGGDILIHGVF